MYKGQSFITLPLSYFLSYKPQHFSATDHPTSLITDHLKSHPVPQYKKQKNGKRHRIQNYAHTIWEDF